MEPELPRPRLPALALLVGRITTIKLAYWTALTALEIALGASDLSYGDRFRASLAVAFAFTLAACAWAAWSARDVDPRVGALERALPTVATAFMAASVVATPASLPLLFIEIRRLGEGCVARNELLCHWEAIWYWVAAVAIGTIVIPLVFALRMRGRRT